MILNSKKKTTKSAINPSMYSSGSLLTFISKNLFPIINHQIVLAYKDVKNVIKSTELNRVLSLIYLVTNLSNSIKQTTLYYTIKG